MRGTLALLLLLVLSVAAAEALVLWQIAYHPATGAQYAEDALRQLLFGAAVPLLGCLVAGVALAQSGRSIPLARFGVALGLGALLMFMGLAQYSHSTPGFFVLGLLVQVGLLLWATLRAIKQHAI